MWLQESALKTPHTFFVVKDLLAQLVSKWIATPLEFSAEKEEGFFGGKLDSLFPEYMVSESTIVASTSN